MKLVYLQPRPQQQKNWVSISHIVQAGNATYYKIFSKQDVSMLINDLFLKIQWNYSGLTHFLAADSSMGRNRIAHRFQISF